MVGSCSAWGADDTLDNGRSQTQQSEAPGKRIDEEDRSRSRRLFQRRVRAPIPVEIVIPPALLKEISTTATDKIAREQRKNKGAVTPYGIQRHIR